MNRFAFAVIAGLVACGPSSGVATVKLEPGSPKLDEIALDPAVTRGQLANGVTYLVAASDHAQMALVIDGELEVVAGDGLAQLRTLADRHARAARMAVIVLGKTDARVTVDAIERAFGSLAKRSGLRVTRQNPVPPGPPNIEIAADHTAKLVQRFPHHRGLDERGYHEVLVDHAVREIMLARVTRLAALDVELTSTPLDADTDDVALSANVFMGGDKLKAENEVLMFVEETARLRSLGIAEADLASWRAAHRRPPTIATLADVAREEIALPSPADEARMAATVTLAEVNAAFHALPAERARLLHADTPSSETELRQREAATRKGPFEPWDDITARGPIVAPRPGAITETKQLDGLTVFELGNGARAILQPSESFSIIAVGPGGWTRVPARDEITARVSPDVALHGSFGDYDATQWKRVMRGRTVEIEGGVQRRSHFVRVMWTSLVGAPHDVEALFATLHLALSRPRADRDSWAFWQTRVPTQPPDTRALFDAKRQIDLAHGDAPEALVTPADVAAIDLDRAVAMYLDQFGDIGSTTFLISGPTPEAARPFVETYLASLAPVGHRIATKPPAIPKIAPPKPAVVPNALVVDYLGPVVAPGDLAAADVDLYELEFAMLGMTGINGMRVTGGLTPLHRPNVRIEVRDAHATTENVQHVIDDLATTGGTDEQRQMVEMMKVAGWYDSLMLDGVERGDDLVKLAIYVRSRLAQPASANTLRAQAKLLATPFAIIRPH